MVVLHTYLSSPLPHRRLAEAGDVKKLLKLRDPDRRQLGDGRSGVRCWAARGTTPEGPLCSAGEFDMFLLFCFAPSSVFAPSSKARSPQ